MEQAELDGLFVSLGVTVEAFAICEVGAGFRLVTRPTDAIYVHHVLAGTLHLVTTGTDPVVCQPGCVAIVPPGVAQRLGPESGPGIDVQAEDHRSTSRDGLLVYDAAQGVAPTLRVICGLIRPNFPGSFGVLGALRRPIAEDLGDVPFVSDAFALMLQEVTAPRMGTRALTSAMMKACLVFLLRRHLARSNPDEPPLLGGLSDPRLGKAVMAILDRPAEPHTVQSLATMAGMSRSAFAREFRNSFAVTPIEFVTRTRLRQAAELLRSTEVAIKVLASDVGFASRSHFTRAFRVAYGADPREYRRLGQTAGPAEGSQLPQQKPK